MQTTTSMPKRITSQGVNPIRLFLNAVEYKGEHCVSCGHLWNEKGDLHYKHCKFFVSSHLHNGKQH